MIGTRSIWILLLLTLGLGFYIWKFEGSPTRIEERRLLSRQAVEIAPPSLKRIQFERNGQTVECVREQNRWIMSRPAFARVAFAQLDRMVTGLAALENLESVFFNPEEKTSVYQEYGFDEPQLVLELEDGYGTAEWRVGRAAPLGRAVYVTRTGSDEIRTASERLLDFVPAGAEALRDRRVFLEPQAAVNRIDLRREEGFVQLGLNRAGRWEVQQPFTAPADPQAVRRMLDAVYQTEVVHFIADEVADLTRYELESPRRQITLSAEKASSSLLIGRTAEEDPALVYAKRLDEYSVCAVSSNILALVYTDLHSLLERTLLPVPADSIRGIQIAAETGKVDLIKKETGRWVVNGSREQPADEVKIKQLLERWLNAKIQAFLLPAEETAPEPREPRWTVTFTLADGSELRYALETRSSDEAPLTLRRGDERLRGQTAERIETGLSTDRMDFYGRTVLRIDPATISRLVQRSGGRAQTILRDESGNFTPAGSNPGTTVQQETLREQLNTLGNLQAVRFIQENPAEPEAFGLNEAQADSLFIGLQEAQSIGRVLLLGATCRDGVYAQIRGQDTVFVLNPETAKRLRKPLLAPPEPSTMPPE
jgi:hypothetical protein